MYYLLFWLILPEELNRYLAEFIRSFRLKDREDYEPSGLTCLVSSIERYFVIFCQLSVCCIISIEKGNFYMAFTFHDRFIIKRSWIHKFFFFFINFFSNFKIRLDLEKKQNNCSSQIIVLLSNKLAKIVFCFIQLPFANLSCSQILMNATMIVMFVMLMLTVPTQMVYIIASVRTDTL